MNGFPLRFAPAPSLRLGIILGAVHLAAAMLLWNAPLPAWARIGGTALLATSLGYHWLRDVWLRLPGSVVGMDLLRDRETGLRVELTRRDGGRLAGRVLGSSLALPWLVVISLRPDGFRRARHVTLLPDTLSGEEFRVLRVALRWGYPAET
jgi:toxin CptA